MEENHESRIVVLSHGSMCEATLQTAKMIGLTDENFITIPMDEMIALDEYEKKVRSTLKMIPKGSLVLVDVYGGTPFNIICKIIKEYALYGLTGFNLPMILEVWCASKYLNGQALQQEVLNAGLNGIKDINAFIDGIKVNDEIDELEII